MKISSKRKEENSKAISVFYEPMYSRRTYFSRATRLSALERFIRDLTLKPGSYIFRYLPMKMHVRQISERDESFILPDRVASTSPPTTQHS